MHCRTCGNKMNDNAELCVKCGVRKNVGNDFCQVCGSATTENMTNCKKCGAKLMKSMSSSQVKKKAVGTGTKAIGTVLLVLGVILLLAMFGQIIVGFTARTTYSAVDSFGAAVRCGIIGGLCVGFGRKLRNK